MYIVVGCCRLDFVGEGVAHRNAISRTPVPGEEVTSLLLSVFVYSIVYSSVVLTQVNFIYVIFK